MKILLVTYDLHAPWDSGHKVYGKGLFDAIQKLDGADIVTTHTLDNSNSNFEDKYDYVHVILAGSRPLTKALKIFRKAKIFKHILTPSIGYRSSVNTRIYYALKMFENRLVKCFSSDFVAKSYFMSAGLIIPPAINTALFARSPRVEEDQILTILESSPVKVGLGNIKGNSKGLILYSGPLTEDRFPYETVLKAISDTKSKILIVGRTSNNGPGVEKVKEIIDFAKKHDLENKVAVALKSLSEDEKTKLINFSDVVIQPFSKCTQEFVAVDPPFFLLESMACEKPVITSKAYSFQRLIKNGSNGYAIDWSDPQQLDRALTDCLTSRHISIKARETIIQNFSLEFVSEKLRKIYIDWS